ncbi:phosphatidylinositol-specific phospholipase C domain-containing protein [Streptomyces bambusae]|uniref:phosphatidylinositol-specific phospholipase C domain-containing protein n=1 Tax=Streptomyces bambusae TaxID=1550616 RepID=UPI001CFE1BEE|nr:phosphatidylinositol-specific phospholipase C domain-containing protein [Streptomyces bambusae]MCB5167364.1 phosphatidylinositol-specific phospholipase C domain-containing protein [Streptomyces bambusae]
MSRPTPHPRTRARRRYGIPARLMTVCAVLGAALLAPTTTAGAAGSTNSDAYRNLGAADRADWLRSYASDARLSELSLPGTHDTLSIHGGAAVQTQEDYGDSADTLTAQLERGIRAIDIRVRVTENKYFTVHHSAYYQQANFDDVLTKAQSFLRSHPGETIVMRLRAECPYTGGSPTDCANDPKSVTSARVREIFAEYRQKYSGLFHAATSSGAARADVPRLGDVRGKLVLGSFDNVDSDAYGIKGFNDNKEDHWAPSSVPAKWAYVQDNIKKAVASSTSSMFVTYTSASDMLNRLPFEFAGGYRSVQGGVTTDVPGVNYQLMKWLTGGGGRIGIVLMDFPGRGLVDEIIARNKDYVVKGGDRAIWLVDSVAKTYKNSRYSRCMVRGPEFEGSTTGGVVTQRECQSTPPSSHQWRAEQPPASYDPKGHFWIKASNGKCLTLPVSDGSAPPAGAQLFWWPCETRWFSGNQMWNIVPTYVAVPGGSTMAYKFISNWTGLCLSMDTATAATAGGKVTQDACPR